MKKIYFGLITALLSGGLMAQTFQEITGTPFDGVEDGGIAFADVDNDNDLDVLVVGSVNFSTKIAKLYLNDGNGIYTEKIGTPFDGVGKGTVSFFDADGDSDMDVLITGEKSPNVLIAKLYLNDSTGVFTEKMGTPFNGAMYSAVGIADIDGDTDMDIVISGVGYSSTFAGNTEIFFNDGVGNYTIKTGPGGLIGVGKGSISFADVDGDTDMDVLITGNDFNFYNAKLYLNDGAGFFTQKSGFTGVNWSSSDFADVDGDNDVDLIITGSTSGMNIKSTTLFLNDSAGNFTIKATDITAIQAGMAVFADMDNDNDMDVLLTGDAGSGLGAITKIFANDGLGVFKEVIGTAFTGLLDSDIAVADIDSDGKMDFMNCGSRVTKLYKNTTCPATTSTDTLIECSPFVWIDGNTYTSSNNSAKDTLTNTFGCDSIISLDLTIDTVSDISTTANDFTITANNDSATAYQWLDCDSTFGIISGETNRSFTAIENGSYAVEITENGCIDTSACVVLTVGLLENTIKTPFLLSPNPTMGNFQIVFEEILNQSEISIYNIHGKLIEQSIHQNTNRIDLTIENQTAGIYFVQINTNQGSQTMRLVKD